MITKIINASHCCVNIDKFSHNKKNKHKQTKIVLKPNSARPSRNSLQTLINETVTLAFKRVQPLPLGFKMRSYKGVTKNNINVGIRETGFGTNDIILTLTNGKFKGKNYALAELRNESKQPARIIPLGEDNYKINTKYVKMINKILKDLI